MILIISAMEPEMDLLIKSLNDKKEKDICGIKCFEGKIGTKYVVVSKCGIGKVNAAFSASILLSYYNPSLLISSGIAGGKELEVKDVVIANKLAYSDVDACVFGYEYGQIPGMPLYFYPDPVSYMKAETILKEEGIVYKKVPILTADIFRNSAKDIKNDIQGAYAVEMEGAALAHAAYRLNIPFLSVRFISDVLDSNKHTKNYQEFEIEAAKLSSKITLKIIDKI